MTVVRVVPVLTVQDLESAVALHTQVLGMMEVMNHGWIVTLAQPDNSGQLSLVTTDRTAPCNPTVSIE